MHRLLQPKAAGRASRNILLHVVVPVIGVIAFILPLYTQYFSLSALFDGDLFVWGYKDENGANIWLRQGRPGHHLGLGRPGLAGRRASSSPSTSAATRPETLARATQAFGGELADDDSDNPDPHAHSMSITH